MKTSLKGIALIKQFEGCVLKVYLCPAGVPTCGYGHTAGLTKAMVGMPITQAQADAYLVGDLKRFEDAVNGLGRSFTQCQFDSLTSFAFNCGVGNLKKLVSNRNNQQIADAMLAYNKGGGKVLAGLVRRRQAERTLFLSESETAEEKPDMQPKTGNPYKEPTKNVKFGSKGNDVRWVQVELNRRGYRLTVDGIAGINTINALRDFQLKHGLTVDGIAGQNTREALKKMI